VILSMYYTLILNLQVLIRFLAIKCFHYDFVFAWVFFFSNLFRIECRGCSYSHGC
jgi:hypothetical protein